MPLLLVAFLGLVAATAATATNTWTDRAGDSGTAPDITSVQVSNSDDRATVTFLISAHLQPNTGIGTIVNPVEGGHELDQPRSIVVAMNAGGGVSTTVYDYYSHEVLGGIPVDTAVSTDIVRFSFPAQALGIHDALAFIVRSYDQTTGNHDQAPDGSGAFYYFFSTPAPPVATKPVIAKATTVPAVALAGKRFTVSFKITRSDTGEVLREGRLMACDPTVAGRLLRHTEGWDPPTVRVSFVIPKSAKGNQLQVRVTITLDGQSATRVATRRIR